jgi:hypothetical protein
MKKLINWRAIVVPTSTAVLVALLLSGAANAITDTVFRYSTPQTGYLAIPANVFTPLDDSTLYNVQNRSQLRLDTDDFACFVTPVNLPQGADMTDLTVWYQNHSAGLAVSLLRKTNLDIFNGFKELARRILPRGDASVTQEANRSIAGPDAIVDNKDNHYWLEYCARNAAQDGVLNSVRITYTYKNAGD